MMTFVNVFGLDEKSIRHSGQTCEVIGQVVCARRRGEGLVRVRFADGCEVCVFEEEIDRGVAADRVAP